MTDEINIPFHIHQVNKNKLDKVCDMLEGIGIPAAFGVKEEKFMYELTISVPATTTKAKLVTIGMIIGAFIEK